MDRDAGDQRRASLRASDADREQFVEALRQHHAEGRLTVEELTERTERAYAARTLGDLDALATDLPPLRRPAAAPAPATFPADEERPSLMADKRARANLVRAAVWYGLLSVRAAGRLGDGRPRLLLADLAHPRLRDVLGWQALWVLGPKGQGRERHRDRDR